MNNYFPTYLKSNTIGDIGINAVSQIVNDDMNFIFKRNHAEYDFGIDAYIEIVTDEGVVTGQMIGVQIKCGKSFFKTKTQTGFTFYGENKHLNYYSNTPFPIIIVICEPNTKVCYWEFFSIEKTDKTPSGWKINIPKRQKMSSKSKEDFIALVGPASDYSEEATGHWKFNELLKDTEFVHYAISKEAIESGNVKSILGFFERILSNDQLAITLQGKVEISVNGYAFDSRSLSGRVLGILTIA